LHKSGPAAELCEPALQMRELWLANPLDAKPAPRIGAERNIRQREIVTLDETSRRQLRIDDAPLRGFGVGILLNRGHVAFLDRSSHQRPEHRPIDRLQGRERPVELAVDARAHLWRLRIKRRLRPVGAHEVAHD